jgi:hypothetical protein
MLRRMFGSKCDEVTLGYRIWHNEFYNLHSLTSMIRIIKSAIRAMVYRPRGREGKCVQIVGWKTCRDGKTKVSMGG